MIGTNPDTYRKLHEAGNIAYYLTFPLCPLLPPGPIALQRPDPANILDFPNEPVSDRVPYPAFAFADVDELAAACARVGVAWPPQSVVLTA